MEMEFSVKLPDRPGELARVSQALEDDGINIRTLSTEASGGIVRLVSSDDMECRNCLQKLGVEFSERNVLAWPMRRLE